MSRAAKVTRLLESGCVIPEPSNGLTLVTVEGDTGRYRVVVGPTYSSCTCRFWRERVQACAHIGAVVAMVTATTDERKVWLAATAKRRAAETRQGGELIDALNGATE